MSERLPQLDRREALGVVIVLSIGCTALASTLDVDVLAGVFAIVGFVVLLPLVGILGDRLPFVTAEEDDATDSAVTDHGIGGAGGPGTLDEPDGPDGQIAILQERYARGEIDEAEFERRLEALLETGGVDAASGASHERPTDRDRSLEPE